MVKFKDIHITCNLLTRPASLDIHFSVFYLLKAQMSKLNVIRLLNSLLYDSRTNHLFHNPFQEVLSHILTLNSTSTSTSVLYFKFSFARLGLYTTIFARFCYFAHVIVSIVVLIITVSLLFTL